MDYYQILGVGKDASEEEIRKAYRKLALEYHPDRNTSEDATKKMSEVNEAYQILSNAERRAAYDRTGGSAFTGGFPGPGGIDDIFNFFHNMHNGGGVPFPHNDFTNFMRQRNGPVHGTVKVSLKDVLTGTISDVKLHLNVQCPTCLGTTVDSTKPTSSCFSCHGSGFTAVNIPGMQARMTCNVCRGNGKSYPACSTCSGSGLQHLDKDVKVKIPKGVQPGNQIQIQIDGAVAVLGIEIEMPENIKIDGNGNVYENVQISYPTLVLGGNYSPILIDGSSPNIKIPAGTTLGQGIRIKGAGIPRGVKNETRGDYILLVELKMPTKISDSERELLIELQKQTG